MSNNNWGDPSTAAQVRDLIKTIVDQRLKIGIPARRRAVVATINRDEGEASVIFQGEVDEVSISLFGVQPSEVGQEVIVESIFGTHYITDIIGDIFFETAISVGDHGALSGLLDNDHPQYALTGDVATAILASEAGQVRDGDAAGGVLAGTYPNPTYASDPTTGLTDHLADTTDAHDASAVSYLGGTGIVAVNVETALDELADEKLNLTGGIMTGAIEAQKGMFQTDLGISRNYGIISAATGYLPTGALTLRINDTPPTNSLHHRIMFDIWEGANHVQVWVAFTFNNTTGASTGARWWQVGGATAALISGVQIGYVTASPYQPVIVLDTVARAWSVPNVTVYGEVGVVFGTDPGSGYMDVCVMAVESSLAAYSSLTAATEAKMSASILGPGTAVLGASSSIILNGTQDVSIVEGTGVLQVGPAGAANIGIDQNEIQARSGAGAASELFLNNEGGAITIGGIAIGDKIKLFSNTYGIGIESGTFTSWAGTQHRWRIGGTSVSTGVSTMVLAAGSLSVGASQILTVDGAFGTPAYSFTSDPNTGLYSYGADSIGFSAGGALRAQLNTLGFDMGSTTGSDGHRVKGLRNPLDQYDAVNLATLTGTTNLVNDAKTPAAPTGLTSYAATKNIVLTWADVTTNADATASTDMGGGRGRYRVEISLTGGGGFVAAETKYTPALHATFSGLGSGINYYFRVAAIDHYGNQSAYSSILGPILPATVVLGDLAYQTITASLVAADTIAFGQLVGGGIAADNIETVRMTVGQSIQSTLYTATDGWQIVANGDAYFHGTVNMEQALVTGSAEIAGNLTVGSGGTGYVKSQNYNGTTPPTGTSTAGWLIDQGGAAEFGGNVWLKGDVVLGGSVSSGQIKSYNYSSGAAGFQIYYDGQAQFNNNFYIGGNATVGGNVVVGWLGNGYVKSSSYVGTTIPTGAATAGWMLWNDGTAEFAEKVYVKDRFQIGSGTPSVSPLIAIHSGNWVSGSAGFLLNGDDGSAQFFNLSARGAIEASSLTPYRQTDILGADGTFESANTWVTVTNSATVARTGTNSGRISTPSGESFSYNTLDKTNVNPDADAWWQVEGYMRAGTTGVTAVVGGKEGASGYSGQVIRSLPDTTNWYYFSFFVFITATATLRISLAALSPSGTSGQFCYFDDITCRRVGALRGDWLAEDLSTYGADGLVHSVGARGARVYRSANGTHNSTGNWVSTLFAAEHVDHENWHESTAGSNMKVYVPETGWYLLTANVEWDTNTTGLRLLGIFKNGVNGAGSSLVITRDTAIATLQQNVAHAEYLNAGDYITMDTWQNSGANRTLTANASTWSPSLSVVKL